MGEPPTLEAWLEPVVDDMDPESGIEDEFKHKHNRTYVWKTLRLVSRQDLALATEATTSDIEAITPRLLGTEAAPKPMDEE